MPAGTIAITKIMDKVNAQVTGVAGIQAVYQGKKRFLEAENFEAQVKAQTAETQGYFAFWAGKRIARGRWRIGELQILGTLYVSLPKDNTSDTNLAYQLADAVLVALQRDAAFGQVGSQPGEGSYELIDDKLEDGIAEFDFEMSYQCALCPGE